MRIVDLHIYGYGQLENVTIKDLSDFQAFYGENEAGKSTIMAFIHSIFFGFPTKQQSIELRYEPKHHNKYGGNIRLFHERFGFGTIERVKGKAAGDVKVVMEDGTIGGEELLQKLLKDFDKALFQAIFSFNLNGLQNIHQMKGEEIGKFLFSTSTIGTERLSKTETSLQKELDALFKPNGKKPLLNEKLQKVHTIQYELRKAAAKTKEYEMFIETKEKLEKEMRETNEQLSEVVGQLEKLNEWKRIETLVKEQRWLETELQELGEVHFPSRGIERMESLNQVLQPFKAEIKSMAERIKLVKGEIRNLEPNQYLIQEESRLLSLVNKVPIYEQLKIERQQCETKIQEYGDKLSDLREKLHLQINEEEILAMNTNILMKNQVELAVEKSKKLTDLYQQLEEAQEEEKDTLEAIEAEIQSIEKQLLSKKDRTRLEVAIKDGNNQEKIEGELRSIQDKIELFRETEKREKEYSKQKKLQVFIFELLFLSLMVYSLLNQQWILLGFGVIGCILVAMFILKQTNNSAEKENEQRITALLNREKQLLSILQSTELRDFRLIEEQLERDNQLQETLKIVRTRHKQQQGQYEKIIYKFEDWERQNAENKENLLTLGRELKLPKNFANTFLLEAFQTLEQYKLLARERNQVALRLEQVRQELMLISDSLHEAALRHLNHSNLELSQTVYLLRETLKKEQEKQIRWNEKKAKLADLEADYKQKVQARQHLQEEYTKLLKEANVGDEQDFYEHGNKAERSLKLSEKYTSISSQLQYSLLSRKEQDEYLDISNWPKIEEEYKNEIGRLQSRLKNLQEQFASTKFEIQTLEEGGVYSDILHQYKEQKFELEEAAKEWAVFSLAQDMLSRTVEKYKNVHLPRMLVRAEEYLFFLTNGNYRKILLKKSGTGFLVERTDGTIFEANELSQATTEQLYVSIRLALSTTLYEDYSFPIIIDDSFVNFDEKRTDRVMELLSQLESNQILFFTCHRHLLRYFKEDSIVTLQKGAIQITS